MADTCIAPTAPPTMPQVPPEFPPDLARRVLDEVGARDALHDTVAFARDVVDLVLEERVTHFLGPAGEAAHVPIAIVGMLDALLSPLLDARADGERNGLLGAALGHPAYASTSPQGRAWAMGMAAVLGGYDDCEIARMESSFRAGSAERHNFREAVQNARASERSEGFQQARREYQRIVREFEDGRAAALGGWDRAHGSEAFRAGRAQMESYLQAHPREADALRQGYRAAHREGYIAAESGRIDERRAARDAAYRAGIASATREHADAAAARAERERVIGVPAWRLAEGRSRG
jgi:hypothetical protein